MRLHTLFCTHSRLSWLDNGFQLKHMDSFQIFVPWYALHLTVSLAISNLYQKSLMNGNFRELTFTCKNKIAFKFKHAKDVSSEVITICRNMCVEYWSIVWHVMGERRSIITITAKVKMKIIVKTMISITVIMVLFINMNTLLCPKWSNTSCPAWFDSELIVCARDEWLPCIEINLKSYSERGICEKKYGSNRCGERNVNFICRWAGS